MPRARAGAALLAPSLCFVGGDLVRRFALVRAFDRLHALGYVASIAFMAVVWAAMLFAASAAESAWMRRAAAALFCVCFALAAAVEASFWSLYHVYYSLDAALYVTSIPWVVVGTLPPAPIVAARFAAGFAVAIAILALARRAVRPRPLSRVWRAMLAVPAIVVVASGKVPVSYAGPQSTTPELIYFNAVSWTVGVRIAYLVQHKSLLARVQRRSPPPLPKIDATPARPRNVLFVLEEAQRADATCIAYDPACEGANLETNALLPDRLPLLHVRANTSSTLVAISNLFTGVDPTECSGRLHGAPLVFDLAHAAGYDTAFWTNQSPIFANYRLFFQEAPIRHRAWGPELDAAADWLAGPRDDLLTSRVIEAWDALEEPFFAVVQYSNIHHPRVYDPAEAPFQPSDPDVHGVPSTNHYKNVVYLSDRAVARLLRHVRASRSGPRTVVVFSSDHGEALYEHPNDNFHASTVYDEELLVPAWIDAPAGTLAPAEIDHVRGARDAVIAQLDLAPTMLDLLGLWDAPAIAPFRAQMMGRPITRGEPSVGPTPITNVSWVWEYWLPNWGLLDWPLKLAAGPNDGAYQCFDLARDPGETVDLGEASCSALVDRAKAVYGVMPRDLRDHLRDRPSWGRRCAP